MKMQSLLKLIYPPRCISCGGAVSDDFSLCGPCWAQTPFIDGLVCDRCGLPLQGPGAQDAETLCDQCLRVARPWRKGRAAMVYEGKARDLVLAFKNAGREELARAAGPWLARAGGDLIGKDSLVLPVPLHWRRLLGRRYNQSALLARAFAREVGCDCLVDGLVRVRATQRLDGLSSEARASELRGAIATHPRRINQVKERNVVLVDDVFTSGATFSACAAACHAAGAKNVHILALARVALSGRISAVGGESV